MQTKSASNFFCFRAAITDLLITLIYYFLFFLISYQEGFQPFRYYLFRISTDIRYQILSFQDLQKYKAQKIVEFSFLVFLANLFKKIASKSYCTMKMVLLNGQNNFYVIMSSYVEGHMPKKIQDQIHVFSQLPGLQNMHVCWKIFCRSIFVIIFRRKQFLGSPYFLIF